MKTSKLKQINSRLNELDKLVEDIKGNELQFKNHIDTVDELIKEKIALRDLSLKIIDELERTKNSSNRVYNEYIKGENEEKVKKLDSEIAEHEKYKAKIEQSIIKLGPAIDNVRQKKSIAENLASTYINVEKNALFMYEVALCFWITIFQINFLLTNYLTIQNYINSFNPFLKMLIIVSLGIIGIGWAISINSLEIFERITTSSNKEHYNNSDNLKYFILSVKVIKVSEYIGILLSISILTTLLFNQNIIVSAFSRNFNVVISSVFSLAVNFLIFSQIKQIYTILYNKFTTLVKNPKDRLTIIIAVASTLVALLALFT